jgi:hypothetical protein
MDRGKRRGDKLKKWVGAIWNNCGIANATNELAANYKHQHNNTTHQYIYFYQQTTKINESTAANNTAQSVGKNENARG